MLRSLLILASLAAIAAPAAAANYSAKPATPVESGRIIVRDVAWACGPDVCLGSTENSRPLVICQGLAKQAGRIESFLVNGRAIEAEELDRCNASARADGNKAVATSR